MHTHEEAQVFVHDVNQFGNCATTRGNGCCSIARQALQRPRVLPWVGQRSESRLTREGKSIICNTDNFVPFVVPGYLSIPEAVRLLHRYHRNRLRKEADQASGNSCFELIFRFSIWAEVTNKPPGDWSRVPWKSKTQIKEGSQEECGRSVGRSSLLVRGFQRLSGACTRTEFSGTQIRNVLRKR